MKGIKPGLQHGLKKNATSASGEQHNGVYTNSKSDFQMTGHVATICVASIVAVAVLVLCGLLCYRQTRQRRRQSWIDQEKVRRQSIRQAVRSKLHELEDIDDSTPWLGQTRIRTSSVTFGDVVLIDPRESPVPEQLSYDGDYGQHQVYHEPHNHHIYSGSKRRVHHIPYKRDYWHISNQQHNQAQILQRQLNIHGDHTRDNNIRKYPNSDHPRFSVHTMKEQTKQHARETPVNSTNIQIPNNDHHKLSLHKTIQPTTKHVPEAAVNFTNIQMPNNEHHKLSLHKTIQPTTKHVPEASVNSTNIHMPNSEHHKLSLHRKFEPATEHARDAMVSSTSLIHMKNNDHHKLSVHKKVEPTAKHARAVSVNSLNSSHMYPAHHSNGSSHNSSRVSNNSPAICNRKVVLHNGYTQRIDKRRSATMPIGMDAVY